MTTEVEEEEFDAGWLIILMDDFRVDFCSLSLNEIGVTML